MIDVNVISALLTLMAGIGVFLAACTMLSTNLETLGSSQLRDLFAVASKSKMLGVGIGALGTAAIQSSGAVTVIIIGFVNAGIMSLAQAATVIYGANIGTTITGQIVAWGVSGEGAISISLIFASLAGIGAFIMPIAKKERGKIIGGILCGFGMLFVGLSMMSGAMEGFASSDGVTAFLASITSPLLLVLIGTVLTAIVQSSSAMTSVCITMVLAGLIGLDQGIFLTMGSNIGSCVVSIIAGLTGTANAKRASLIHLLFNVTGVLLFMLIGEFLLIGTAGAVTLGTIFGDVFSHLPIQIQLAMFHTVFNVVTVLLVLPFTDALVALVCRIIPDDPKPKEHVSMVAYIDDALLPSPPIAVQQVKNEILRMAGLTMRNVESCSKMIKTDDLSDKEQFNEVEKDINFLNRELERYIARLFSEYVSEEDGEYLSRALLSISDLERVGDYAEEIASCAEGIGAIDASFSPAAAEEVRELTALIDKISAEAVRAYATGDREEFERASATYDAISEAVSKAASNHTKRISKGICSPGPGALYLTLLSDFDHIGVHYYRLALLSV